MNQLAGIQDHKGKGIDTIKHISSDAKCRQCERTCSDTKERSPVWNTMCSTCGRKNCWIVTVHKYLSQDGSLFYARVTSGQSGT